MRKGAPAEAVVSGFRACATVARHLAWGRLTAAHLPGEHPGWDARADRSARSGTALTVWPSSLSSSEFTTVVCLVRSSRPRVCLHDRGFAQVRGLHLCLRNSPALGIRHLSPSEMYRVPGKGGSRAVVRKSGGPLRQQGAVRSVRPSRREVLTRERSTSPKWEAGGKPPEVEDHPLRHRRHGPHAQAVLHPPGTCHLCPYPGSDCRADPWMAGLVADAVHGLTGLPGDDA
jgi:hypothetical protein